MSDDEFFYTVHQIAKLRGANDPPPHQDVVNLVSSDDEDEEAAQPPAKRAKTDAAADYIPLVRRTLKFSRKAEEDAPPPEPLHRLQANSFYALRYSKPKGLSITAKSRKFPAVSDGAFSPDEIGGLSDADMLILGLAKKSAEPGCLFTAFFFSIDVDSNTGTVSLVIDLELRWMLCSYVSNAMHNDSVCDWRKHVLMTFFPDAVHGGQRQDVDLGNDTWSPQDFYESAHVTRKDDGESDDLYVPGLTANLFPFQRRAVKWLLRREGVRWAPEEAASAPRGTEDGGEPSVVVPYRVPEDREITSHFVAVKDADGETCYVSELFGAATRDPAYFEAYENNIRGGILSEEMGLGKTVEIISLILLHPRPADLADTAVSQSSRQTPAPRPTGATLVIAPPALKNQWISEIQQHAPHLRVMVYAGMARSCSTAEDEANVVEQFATHDVVVTTYTDLKSELHFAVAPPERNMRSQADDIKRYRPRSPLVQMSWWRVCLDEAQEIENGVSNTATLVRIVPRINAWGVTGTPVKDDVQGKQGIPLD